MKTFVTSDCLPQGKAKNALHIYGTPLELGSEETWGLWNELRQLSVMPFSAETSLWRISTAPTKAPEIVAAIQKFMPSHAFYDWSGGLIWLEVPAAADAGAADVRRAVAVRGGHATLIRAQPKFAPPVEVFEPMKPEIERLTRGIKDGVRSARPSKPRPDVRQSVSRDLLNALQSTLPIKTPDLSQATCRQISQSSNCKTRSIAEAEQHSAALRPLRLVHGDVPDLRAARR